MPKVICTGWALDNPSMTMLPLSNHSDYNEITKYIKASECEAVYPFSGGSQELYDYIRLELGLELLV